MITAFQIRSFIRYWLDAVDSHSLHSPFFYDFYEKVIQGKASHHNYSLQESLRKKLLENEMEITITDLGAGSAHFNGKFRKVKDIARVSLSPPKFSQLYARITTFFHFKNIVELGTSLGINTLYLAAEKNSTVTTFEGSPEIAEIAKDTFSFAAAENIRLIQGDIEKSLPKFLMPLKKVDFVFMDANHRYTPTVQYFKLLLTKIDISSVIVIDDIHYSPEMEKAWNEIKNHTLVYGSIDLYRIGILFFDPSLNKQHVVLQF
jgi:predicted O-methyltransferase YrrM